MCNRRLWETRPYTTQASLCRHMGCRTASRLAGRTDRSTGGSHLAGDSAQVKGLGGGFAQQSGAVWFLPVVRGSKLDFLETGSTRTNGRQEWLVHHRPVPMRSPRLRAWCCSWERPSAQGSNGYCLVRRFWLQYIHQLLSRSFELAEAESSKTDGLIDQGVASRILTHNPEVLGSNPTPATCSTP